MLNILFYCLAALVGILLYDWFKAASDDIVKILLYPHARLTEIYYNISLTYMKGIGYAAPNGSFAIGRECMGSSFVIMLFGMTVCMFVKYFKGAGKAAWFIISLAGAVLIGVFVSCIRIIGSVPFAAHPKFALFHSGIGISLYFFALTACYTLLNRLFGGDKCEKSI